MWANDSTGLPSGTLTAPAPRPWDYCFRDLRADPIVRWPGELELTVSSDCEDWIIYDMEDDWSVRRAVDGAAKLSEHAESAYCDA